MVIQSTSNFLVKYSWLITIQFTFFCWSLRPRRLATGREISSSWSATWLLVSRDHGMILYWRLFRERFFCKPSQANLTIWMLNFGTPPYPVDSRCGQQWFVASPRKQIWDSFLWQVRPPGPLFIRIFFPCFTANLGKMYEVQHHHLLGFTDACWRSQQTVELGTAKSLIWWDRIFM